MESAYQTSKLEKLLHRTTAALFVLSAVCFMIYTTELHYAHAEGEEDLGSASSSLDASVTVGTACNFSGNVDIPHTSTVINGVNSTDIGKTTMNVTCNDQGGYAVYAIGYTNDEYGNTALQSSISDDYNISTGTSTSGNTSNWSMKLATVSGTTTATIENGYNNYSTVPDDYTKVATLNTITNPGTSTTGSSISTTYQIYISPTQPAGTYTGKVKYTLVHPSSAPAPEKPKTINDLTYMQELASFSEADKTSVLSSMTQGQQYQLKDSRDQKEYYISKLADNNIWMTQNLDFDIVDGGANLNSTNTDVPANWADAGNLANTYATNDTTWNWSRTTPESYDPGNLYWNGRLNTNWTGKLYDMTTSTGNFHYHIGNYYNWTVAVAMSDSGSYTTDRQDANQSICPAGWRLPTYSGDKSYQNLVDTQGLTAGTSGNIQNAPAYFVYGGSWSGSSESVGSFGGYLSSVAGGVEYGQIKLYELGFRVDGGMASQAKNSGGSGNSLRCVAR